MNATPRTHVPLVAAAILTLLAPLAPARAQEAPTPAPGAPTEQLPSLDQLRVWYQIQKEKLGDQNEEVRNIGAMIRALAPPSFDVSFSGGTVAAYLDAIRAAFPAANIVGAQGLDQITLPRITLTAVTIEGALRPLEAVARDADGRSAELSVYFTDGVAAVAIPESSLPEPPRTLVLNMSSLTDIGVPMPQVHEAMQTALSIFPGPPPEARFHEATGVVVVRGTPEQLSTVQEVLQQMRESTASRRAAFDDLRARRAKAEELTQSVRTLELLIANLETRRSATAQGEESDKLDQTIWAYRADLDKARATQHALQESLAQAEQQAKAPGTTP